MRMHAQKQSKPQQEASLHLSRLTQRTIRHQAILGLPHASTEPGKMESIHSALTRFAHDFSRIPVYSQERAKNQMSQQPAAEANVSLFKHALPSECNHAADKFVGGLNEGTLVGNSGPAVTPANPSATRQEGAGVEDDDAATETPPKLTKKQVGEIYDLGCGGFKYDIRWELDKPTNKGGLIMQRVEWKYDVDDCEGNKFDMMSLSWYKDYQGPYWEAWEIRKGQKVTTVAERGVPFDDEYSAPSLPKTNGSVWVTGTAGFYEGMKLPPDFEITGKPPAGALPMSMVTPVLTGGTGTIPHSFGIKDWGEGCCP